MAPSTPGGPKASVDPSGRPSGLPPLQEQKPLAKAPLPKSGFRNGALVAGFPTGIISPVPGSDVISSSIATEKTVMQLSLVGVSSSSPNQLRAHYRSQWQELGLDERGGKDGEVAFVGAHESLTLSIARGATGNRYTVFGVLRTE